MATNKNAIIRYQALDKCFRNPGRKYFMEDLIDACNDALFDLDSKSTGVKRRQIFDDIKFMRDSRGYDAPIESYKDGKKAYYRYEDLDFSINNQPLNEQEAQQLKESLLTLSRFKGMPQFEWVEEIKARLDQSFKLTTEEQVLSFDENPFLTGREYIGELYHAIINKQVLEIEYHPFKRDDSILFTIHPYHLKQYNNRWFLFGMNNEYQTITNIALDRIKAMKESKIAYLPNTEINFEEFFEDVIGVTIPEDKTLHKVILRIDNKLWPYIKTKPIHGSQKPPKEENDAYAIIELELMLNYELESIILSYGEQMEVLEPKVLRDNISSKIKRMKLVYF